MALLLVLAGGPAALLPAPGPARAQDTAPAGTEPAPPATTTADAPQTAAPVEPVPATAETPAATAESVPAEGAAPVPEEAPVVEEPPPGIAAAPAEGVPQDLPTEESVPPGPEPAQAVAPPEGAPEAAAPEAPSEAPAPPADWSKAENPVPADAASIERGRKLYLTKALCYVCHGENGDGFGPVRIQFNPLPNAFIDPEWQKSFTDGQLMGVLHEGKFGTGMIAMVPDFMTEAEGWDVINYLRTFSGKTTDAYVREQAEIKKAKAAEIKRIEEQTQ